ncbi:hypothetical protein H4R22_002863 [Coemansia sp. RSA 1290]|nr:hypothetical protein BX667DRAFT_518520 [Coemansia mojavensis]KAJ2630164.1 hypothetical protein H4R22_002863 [Coemansia sp. RSA 1290]KAJ2646662.1 hypothetical protein IWW40_005250 [Coemansia sp. RSA 1250]KAJ2668448.1 hypothetical protein IWW42_005178 [Coemansia sp. RSA 1085]
MASESHERRHSRDAGAMADSFLKSMGDSLERSSERTYRSARSPRDSRSRRRSPRRMASDRHRDYRRGSRDRSRRRRSRSRRRYRSREDHRRSRRDDAVPLHLRAKKLNMWDLAPPGFENISSMEAKASGMFPPPGQSAGSRNVASFNPSVLFEHTHRNENDPFRPSSRGEREFPSTAQRQARRLYVGNIPFEIDEDSIASFFNDIMVRLNIAPPDELPVQNIQINHDKNYAFVEFRNADQATMGMGLDGIMFQNQKVKIRRPKDYIPPPGEPEPKPPVLNLPGILASTVPDSPDKVYVGGLPTYLNDVQVMELLQAFGELKSFNLVKDSTTQTSRGFAFCEYMDPSMTDIACQGLNGMELGDRRLVVQRASIGARAGSADQPAQDYMQHYPIPSDPQGLVPATKNIEPTSVIQLLNMVTPAELADNAEYEDIMEDVREECSTFGAVVDLVIPRNSAESPDEKVPGVGKIFVKFSSISEATAALNALAGRQFSGRTVIASYITEDDFSTKNF